MITVTADSFQRHVLVGAGDITLNGPPSALRGHIVLSNRESEKLFLRDIQLLPKAKGKRVATASEAIRVTTTLNPKEEKKHDLCHRVDPKTPPGEYTYSLQVGGAQKNIRMVVQPHIEIDLHPLTIYFQGVAAGQNYQAELMLTNHGNLPFTVPSPKHVIALDYDFLCRASSFAIKDHGYGGFMAMMDQMTKSVSEDIPDWVAVRIKEAGTFIAPGATSALHVSLTLPKNVDPSRDYYGNLRIWNRVLSYHIKSH